ncbi:class I SAM-dependent DNA methyltransferase, partial [Guyparkeria sp.]|uniref:class I SAM-dependent DNA methyltransferase n=1 Tax=Guyparkeria sp. TaxID=2035736 RepID=UPI003970C014
SGYDVERVAHFLKRCLFTMFSEDVGLIPNGQFTALLERLQETPENFPDAIESLWRTMNSGGYCGVLNAKLQQFNGGLFQDINPIPLDGEQIGLLINAAKHDWSLVEPAIFGTLLERALDPRERHKLGAHYTPRAYVERLVMPTLIEPLREQWRTIQVAAETWLQAGKQDKALKELQDFHHQLCNTRVLDPACGSGNFLYVALEHMKRLEGEVLNTISDLSGGQMAMETEGLTVDPHQFLGLELNPRAAAIAEIVLWIGYLQWHYRIRGRLNLPEPILRDFKNIENRDALIEYDSREPMLDDDGNPVTLWDGISYKESPVTGELIPDETQRIPVYRYHNPRKAEWPEAEYIVGNPPFIGASTMRRALGDGYVDAVRKVYSGEVPDSADFVMYWWHTAAHKVRHGEANRFGFITTNSLRQTFNRRVLEPHLNDKKKPLSLLFAIPDHPWVEANDGAAVRIAMTVGGAGEQPGVLRHVVSESSDAEDARSVQMDKRQGKLFADLAVGANVAGAQALHANSGLSFRGVSLIGNFELTHEQSVDLGLNARSGRENRVRPFINGRDIIQSPSNRYVIDLFGMSAEQAKSNFPALYQWLYERVKPERDAKSHTKDGAAYAKNWWLFGKPRQEMRKALWGIKNFLITPMTAKHRLFISIDHSILPDQGLIVIALDDSMIQGVLSSRIHNKWTLSVGGTLEDRPRYNNSRCFETFPFPELTEAQATTIGDLADKIDAHRKRVQADHPDLTQAPSLPRMPMGVSASITSSRKRIVPASRNVVVPLRSISTAASCAEQRSSGISCAA